MPNKKKVESASSQNNQKSQNGTKKIKVNHCSQRITKSQQPEAKSNSDDKPNPNRYTLFDQEKLEKLDIENYLKDTIKSAKDPYHCVFFTCKGEPFLAQYAIEHILTTNHK